MMGGAKAHYDGIVAFSQTDFTEDLTKITVAAWRSWPISSVVIFCMVGPVLGAAPMQKVLEYEHHAAECRQMAAQMKNSNLKKRLEDMAEVWDRLANDRRKGIVENEQNKG
jgi:hypothetical protein